METEAGDLGTEAGQGACGDPGGNAQGDTQPASVSTP